MPTIGPNRIAMFPRLSILTSLAFAAVGVAPSLAEAQTPNIPPPFPPDTPSWSAAVAFTEASFTKPPPRPSHTRDERIWYGMDILTPVLIADGMATTIYVYAKASAGNDFALFGYLPLLGRSLTGPIVHWTHGHVGRGFGSLLLNVGVPFSATLFAFKVTDTCGDYEPYTCFERGLSMGLLMGLLTGIGVTLVETTQFSYDEPEKTQKKEAGRPSWTLGILPTITSNRVELNVMGQF